MGLLTPTRLHERVTDITPQELHTMGVCGLLLDVDNTLTTHYAPDLSPAVQAWIDDMRAAGVSMTVVSNSKRRRVEPFALQIGLPCVWMAAKPLPFGFFRAVRRMGLPRRKCLVVGDQSFTDTLGARLGGFRCVQLMPIQLEVGKPFLMFKRRLEKPVLAHIRRRMKKGDST